MQPPAAAAMPALLPGDPAERKQHREEEDEGRDQQRSGEAPAVELRHQRDQHQTGRARTRHESAQVVLRMADVGIGKRQIVGLFAGRLAATPGCMRPELAGPARGARRSAQNSNFACLLPRCCGSRGARVPVPSVLLIIDQDDAKGARIVLPQKASDRLRDDICFIARGHDGHDARPCAGRGKDARCCRARATARIPRARAAGRAKSRATAGQERQPRSCQIASLAEPGQSHRARPPGRDGAE